jgi:hypothetical protein
MYIWQYCNIYCICTRNWERPVHLHLVLRCDILFPRELLSVYITGDRISASVLSVTEYCTVCQSKTVGRAIAQAVSRWLPTAAARVRARFWSSGICGGQSGAGAGFLRILRFLLPIFIPPNSPSS